MSPGWRADSEALRISIGSASSNRLSLSSTRAQDIEAAGMRVVHAVENVLGVYFDDEDDEVNLMRAMLELKKAYEGARR